MRLREWESRVDCEGAESAARAETVEGWMAWRFTELAVESMPVFVYQRSIPQAVPVCGLTTTCSWSPSERATTRCVVDAGITHPATLKHAAAIRTTSRARPVILASCRYPTPARYLVS